MPEILDEDFTQMKTVSQDARGRVTVGKAGEARLYSVSRNRHGQILLTPVVQIPEYEVRLWRSPEALASIRRGLDDEAAGRIHDLGSFAPYADAETDD